MDSMKIEVTVPLESAEMSKTPLNDASWQLNDLQLALVGGGIGDVVPA